MRETDLEKLSFSSQLARAFGSDVSLHMVWLIQRDFLLGDNIDSFLEPTGLSPKTDEIRDGIRVMSETNHVIGLPQPHLDRTALCDIDEAEYDKRYLEARDKLRRLVKEDLPSRVLKKDVNGALYSIVLFESVAGSTECVTRLVNFGRSVASVASVASVGKRTRLPPPVVAGTKYSPPKHSPQVRTWPT